MFIVGWTQSTIKGGERSSSATSYLAPKYAQRSNLHVLIHARVSRVISTGSVNGKPIFKTVEYAADGVLEGELIVFL